MFLSVSTFPLSITAHTIKSVGVIRPSSIAWLLKTECGVSGWLSSGAGVDRFSLFPGFVVYTLLMARGNEYVVGFV